MTAWIRSRRALPALLAGLVGSGCTARPAPATPAGSGSTPPARPELVVRGGSPGQVWAVAFSPDGQSLASGSYHGALNLWDARTGRLRRELTGHNGRVEALAFSPDSRTLASGSTDGSDIGDVKLWDVPAAKLRRTILAHDVSVTALGFSPDGRTLASAGHYFGESKEGYALVKAEVSFWSARSGRRLRCLRPPSSADGASLSALSPDLGLGVLSTFVDGNPEASGISLWSLRTGRRVRVLGPLTGATAFSPDGRFVAVGSGDAGTPSGEARVYEVSTGGLRHALSEKGHWMRAVAFSPDGRLLASGGGAGTTILWDLATGGKVRALTGQKGVVRAIAFSPDGRRIATGSGDYFQEGGDWGEVRIWRVADGRLLATLLTFRDGGWEAPARPAPWLVHTPAGDYDGSPGIERFLRWRVDGKLLPGKTFAQQHRRRVMLE